MSVNRSIDYDKVLIDLMNGDYGDAWKDWCDSTRGDRDPVTGESRGGTGRDSDDNVGSRDRD